jgi:hypothetical protein
MVNVTNSYILSGNLNGIDGLGYLGVNESVFKTNLAEIVFRMWYAFIWLEAMCSIGLA